MTEMKSPNVHAKKNRVDANINSFGAAGTTLEAGLLFTTTTETKTCDLYVTYGSKVFKFTLDI